jgi:signal transduction histidine kinase
MQNEMLYDAAILIVDDEPLNIDFIEVLLRRAGYRNLTSTGDSRQVLPLCTSLQPDLILLDLHMPPPDGFAVLEALAPSLAQGTYLPVLVLTADVSRVARERALSMGAKDFLTKPLDVTEVRLRVKNLLETRLLHRRLQRHNELLQEEVRARTAELDAARVEIVEGLTRWQAASHLREGLLMAAAHELRTPLTVIRGRADMLQGQLERECHVDDEWLRAQMDPLRRAIARMVTAVEECTLAAQLQSGQQLALRREPLDLGALVEQVVASLAETVTGKRAAVVVEAAPRIEVQADALHLGQVVYSIVAIALKYGAGVAPVRVETRVRGDAAVLTVSAPGVDVAAYEDGRAFTDFYRGLTPIVIKGMGLGLGGCAHVMEQHGGQLIVARADGGTTVKVTLPAVRAAHG